MMIEEYSGFIAIALNYNQKKCQTSGLAFTDKQQDQGVNTTFTVSSTSAESI